MTKQPNPAKLIRKRARKLPLHECLVNSNWQENDLANVLVSRKHVNGNFTIGLYLVDLKCLGVKDTHYMFNIDRDERARLFDQAVDRGSMTEIDYKLAHNIVFAGYEFALDLGIEAHKDFEKTTKYILEKDDENVPLIDIECGEEGTPHYVQSEFENGTFAGKIIRILEKNVGPGNFMVTRFD